MCRYLLTICIVLLTVSCTTKYSVETETIKFEDAMSSLVRGFDAFRQELKILENEYKNKNIDYRPYGLTPTEATVVFQLSIFKEGSKEVSLGAAIPILKKLDVEGYSTTSIQRDTRTNTFTIKFEKICDPYELKGGELPPCPSNEPGNTKPNESGNDKRPLMLEVQPDGF